MSNLWRSCALGFFVPCSSLSTQYPRPITGLSVSVSISASATEDALSRATHAATVLPTDVYVFVHYILFRYQGITIGLVDVVVLLPITSLSHLLESPAHEVESVIRWWMWVMVAG